MATNSVVACNVCYGHLSDVLLTKIELLLALKAKQVTNAQMERALGLPSSRVSEILRALPDSGSIKPPRELSYDEGVKLARAFGLDESPAAQQIPQVPPGRVLRLVARHMADSLGAEVSEELLEDLSEDLRAFALFVADPTVRKTMDMAEGFFRGMRLRRLEDRQATPPESDPHHAH